jgi:hypothetical protein
MIVGFALMIPYFLFIPETRSGVLLARRAKRLRKETGNTKLFAEHEILGHRPFKQVIQETLLRPVYMLCTEPIVFWFALLDGKFIGLQSQPLTKEVSGYNYGQPTFMVEVLH